MKELRIFILAIAVLLSTSCTKSLSDKISIESCENVSLMGFTALKADLGLRNESGRKIELQQVSLTLKESGSAIATITLKDTIVVPRKTALMEVPTVWRISELNLMAAMAASKSIASGSTSAFRVEVAATGKWGAIKRDFYYPALSLTDLLESVNY